MSAYFRCKNKLPGDPARHLPAYFYRQRRRQQRARSAGHTQDSTLVPTVAEIVDSENLIRVFYDLKRRAGQAPGLDCITYDSLGCREVGHNIRALAEAVKEGLYRPSPARRVPIPKTSGGYRVLALRNISDRVLSSAINEALCPLWKGVFHPRSMGFQPLKSVWKLLVDLEIEAAEEERWVLAVDDVKNAFDNVNIDDVLNDHRKYIAEASLLSLIEVVLRGSEGKRIGIDQGSAYSPTALNVRLHHAHDLGLSQGHHLPWYRYADNIVYLCQDMSEGDRVLSYVKDLLEEAGLHLKGKDGAPKDLRKRKVEFLGFKLHARNGLVRYECGPGAWQGLRQDLIEAHEVEDPPARAEQVVTGWIEYLGPAFENRAEELPAQIRGVASNLGFREVDTYTGIQKRCNRALERWRMYRKGIRRRKGELTSQ